MPADVRCASNVPVLRLLPTPASCNIKLNLASCSVLHATITRPVLVHALLLPFDLGVADRRPAKVIGNSRIAACSPILIMVLGANYP